MEILTEHNLKHAEWGQNNLLYLIFCFELKFLCTV
jgi:hypothetical protein